MLLKRKRKILYYYTTVKSKSTDSSKAVADDAYRRRRVCYLICTGDLLKLSSMVKITLSIRITLFYDSG